MKPFEDFKSKFKVPDRAPDITGKFYNNYFVIGYWGSTEHGKTEWVVECIKCKDRKIMLASHLTSHKQKGLNGCLKCRTKFKKGKDKLKRKWRELVNRITNPKSSSYNWYNLNGFKLDPRWLNYESFKEDMKDFDLTNKVIFTSSKVIGPKDLEILTNSEFISRRNLIDHGRR